MLSRLARSFAACAVALVFAACASAPGAAKEPAHSPGPGLWVVKDKDSTIYLFGTVHMLKPETVWHTPKIDAAIASASELWLEIPTTDQTAMVGQMMPLIQKYGLSKGKKLSELLTPEEMKTLNAAAALAGLPVAGLDMFRPWFAAVGVSSAEFQNSGYDPASGVDTKIEGIFKARQITPKGLESVEDQIMVFATMSDDVELAFLRSTLKEFKDAPTELTRMVDSWAAGDTGALEKLFVTEMKDEDKGLYQRLLVDRNTKWAGEIQEMLKGKGVAVIAVGAGHLVGPDSVQVQLAKLGVTAKRE